MFWELSFKTQNDKSPLSNINDDGDNNEKKKKKKNLKTRVGIFKNMGGNILGGNFPDGNFPGGVWWVGIFRVGVFLIPSHFYFNEESDRSDKNTCKNEVFCSNIFQHRNKLNIRLSCRFITFSIRISICANARSSH